MSAFQILLLLFFTVPLAEIYILIKVGGVIGALPTIALVVLTALAGAALMRAQGFSTLARIRRSLDVGELPAVALLEGAVILAAGALLLTPGFVTDAVGFACLMPPWRRALIERLLRRLLRPTDPGARPPPRRGRIIDADYRRDDEP